MIRAGISPAWCRVKSSGVALLSTIAWRASRVHVGHSEVASRGTPSVGRNFSCDFSSGVSDQAGVIDGLGAMR